MITSYTVAKCWRGMHIVSLTILVLLASGSLPLHAQAACDNASTQAALNECAAAEADTANETFSRLTAALSATLDERDLLELKVVLASWRGLRSAYCRWATNGQGSVRPMSQLYCESEWTWSLIGDLRLHLCEGRGLTGICAAADRFRRPSAAQKSSLVAERLLLRVDAAPTATQLAEAMALGQSQSLDNLAPPKRELFLRLYSVENEGACVDETEWVCSHTYYLAVSEYGAMPQSKVYGLGQVGEIARIEWVSNNHDESATLRLHVLNYPAGAVKQNQKLKQATSIWELRVGLQYASLNRIK